MKRYYKTNGIPPGEPTMKGSNADPYVADVALPNVELGDYSVPTNWPTNVKFNEPGDVPGPVIQFEDEDQSDVKAGYGFESDNLYEGDWFFFHTDHLGSTSYLTDTAGNVSQFVCYTPYGEAIVDEHLTTYENPFKFSGKELDDITGLYDHGARSRNPMSTLWYGIDPLFEKYPEMSPYGYCHANPIRLIDPTGMFDTEEEAIDFGMENELTFRVCKMENGGYEVYDENTRNSYAYNSILLDQTEVIAKKVYAEKNFDQKNGSLIFGMNDQENGIESTSVYHDKNINPCDLVGTEGWIVDLLGRLKKWFQLSKISMDDQDNISENGIMSNPLRSPAQPSVINKKKTIYNVVGKDGIWYVYDTIIVNTTINEKNNEIINQDTIIKKHK